MPPYRKTESIGALIVFFLSVCLFIYIFYRPEGTLINIFLRAILPVDALLIFKQELRMALPLNEAMVYSLPGGLWVFCATLLASQLKISWRSKNIALTWLPMLFALWLEFWQYFGVVKGRFDVVDILFVLIFGLLAKAFFNYHHLAKNNFAVSNRPSRAFILVFVCVFMAHVF